MVGQPLSVRAPRGLTFRENETMQMFINFLLFQIAWFACVLGAANNLPWVGPLVVGLIVIYHLRARAFRWPRAATDRQRGGDRRGVRLAARCERLGGLSVGTVARCARALLDRRDVDGVCDNAERQPGLAERTLLAGRSVRGRRRAAGLSGGRQTRRHHADLERGSADRTGAGMGDHHAAVDVPGGAPRRHAGRSTVRRARAGGRVTR